MKIHIYDYLNKNKIAQLKGEDFISVQINHTIDDFSSCKLTHSITESISNFEIRGFENIYIEDDDGFIIFGGILVSIDAHNKGGSLTAYDHRWILTRLILDDAITIASSDDVLDKVAELIAVAKAKRQIPIDFDREASAINDNFRADLHFNIGDDIGTSLQKIIQTIYARWAMRYKKVGGDILGSLIVRSVQGVTPEGVGISRSRDHSEDGDIITLYYGEGDPKSNLQEFKFNFDLSKYTSRTKIGVKLEGESSYEDAPPDPTSSNYEYFFGQTEGFITDYKANSQETALALATINQVYPRLDVDVLLSPDFKRRLNCGDRVGVRIVSPIVTGINDNSARIDGITYSSRDGYLEVRMFVNFSSPQKRTGTTGLLQAISGLQQGLDDLNQNYFNS